MPIFHCKACHHEWEEYSESVCDWCGADSEVLQEESELERFVRNHRNVHGGTYRKTAEEARRHNERLRFCLARPPLAE